MVLRRAPGRGRRVPRARAPVRDGAARLPPGGLLAPPLEVAVDASLDARLLPTAHTCFNQLALPRYASKAALREKLVLAATEGGGSFSLI